MLFLGLFITGLLSGFIDSIAGGGGLINVPVLMLVLGPGPGAIGTNKIAGTLAAAMALLVYARAQRRIPWKELIGFTACVSVGAFAGSQASPLVPPDAFRWFLALTCPAILWLIWNRGLWLRLATRQESAPEGLDPAGRRASPAHLAIAGVACGFYDGIWGPAGGTFMLLALLFVAHQPLLAALFASKFANTFSAGSSFAGYAWGGHVRYAEGICLGLGCAAGAFAGARMAATGLFTGSPHATRLVRIALAVVASLLAVRLVLEGFEARFPPS